MQLERVNMWDRHQWAGVYVATTTNSMIKANGRAAMGKGNALEASQRFPKLATGLAELLKLRGNHVFYFPDYKLFTFPTKHNNPWANSDLALIEQSAQELRMFLDAYSQVKTVYLPQPGCGNGRLDWKDVEPVLDRHLDDRVIVVYQ
jgi:hypothetical protein